MKIEERSISYELTASMFEQFAASLAEMFRVLSPRSRTVRITITEQTDLFSTPPAQRSVLQRWQRAMMLPVFTRDRDSVLVWANAMSSAGADLRDELQEALGALSQLSTSSPDDDTRRQALERAGRVLARHVPLTEGV